MHPDLCEGAALLMKHEGFREVVYKDTKGKLTIGYGLNLEDRGVTEEQARRLMLDAVHDLDLAFRGIYGAWYDRLNSARKWVCLNMAYQMGFRGFGSFKKMIAALELAANKATPADTPVRKQVWRKVKDEMLDSQWARNFPDRANELAGMMEDGTW